MVDQLISIIILTYKKFDYIKECLDSVLKQDYKNIEIIISDDGTENFDDYNIEQYIKNNKSPNITSVIINKHKLNVGTVRNFNDAIKKSSGKYIVPLAADDMFYSESAVSSIVSYFQSNNSMISISYRKIFDKSMSEYIETKPNAKELSKIEKDAMHQYRALCKESFISGAGASYSKEFFDKYGYFDEEYLLAEDYPTFLRATREGVKIHLIPESIIKYRSDGISTQAQVHPLLDKDLKKAIEKEILPYRNIIGTWLYRIKKFELEKYKIKTAKNTNAKLLLILLMLKNIDITLYKVFYKIGLKLK